MILFLSHFSMKFLCANRIAPDGTPRSAASHLGLNCLPKSNKMPMSHKRDARHIRVKRITNIFVIVRLST